MCVCDTDEKFLKRVICEGGGVAIPGSFDIPDLDADVDVLIVSGPTDYPNTFRMTSNSFVGKKFIEVHLTNSQSDFTFNRLFVNVAPTLEVLNLTHNRISVLPESAFRDLLKLRELYLSNNVIDDIPSVLGAGSTNLQVLDISHNPIGTSVNLKDTLLAHFTNLQTLNVAGIELESVSSIVNILRSNPKLEELDLSNNAFLQISQNQFSGLSSLKRLILSGNHQTEIIANGAFSGTSLEYLDLSGIRGDLLKSGMFQGARIEKLNLSAMNLTIFTSDSLGALATSLISLDISGNSDIKLEASMFSTLTGLKELSLAQLGQATLVGDLFAHTNVLESLDLSGNGITELDDEFFSHLPLLTHVNLADNKLTRIPLLSQNPKLESFDVSNNALTAFPESLTTSLSSLKSVHLNGNPWKCDCGIASLGRWLKDQQASTSGYEKVCVGNGNFTCPVCADPIRLRGQSLNSLPASFNTLDNCAPEYEPTSAASTRKPSVLFSVPFLAVLYRIL
ncbi:putative Leucine-rich repeat-containing protein 15 [Hypsibius exemplaris]|uniref:Leucine-rich repeat-containing protein 15 n=1 Tax=Hypsibius exemplaris TaxID=2072580 RepID=A0A1W0X5R3_HYPEX|nr:putative Leucine-rich repeat-containing protein 15 [Hypsibius exemplaris]